MAAAAIFAACAPPAPPPRQPVRMVCAETPTCPGWTDLFQGERLPVHVHLFDRVVHPACAEGVAVHASVAVDGDVVGETDLACVSEGGGAPIVTRVDGPEIPAGLHEIAVRVGLPDGVVESSQVMSLPAFDLAEGRGAVLGSEVVVEITRDDVVIAPPRPYPPRH